MSKQTIRVFPKRQQTAKDDELPVILASNLPTANTDKISEALKEMAQRLLENPKKVPPEPTLLAVLILASTAWNSAVGDHDMRDCYQEYLDEIDWKKMTPLAGVRCKDTTRLIEELIDYKKEHYPNDLRIIIATEMNPKGTIRVYWAEPENVIPAAFSGGAKTSASKKIPRYTPIADKLVKKMQRLKGEKVIDLKSVITGRQHAEDLQKTVASWKDLADYHPAHAIYIYTQNQLSVMAELLSALKEMDRFTKLISEAEDEYMPSGPPISPLTNSFFTCWSMFDVCVGIGKETIGTTAMAVGKAFGMHKDLVRVLGLMQESRMAVYVHEGKEKDKIVLRELVTNKVCKAISPAGYKGARGELWYARVLPPPLPELDVHVIFTTPYRLIKPGEREWLSYFERVFAATPTANRIGTYENHMKYGPERNYWNEFVMEAYVNHTSNVILLHGLPDIAESRPHSRANSI